MKFEMTRVETISKVHQSKSLLSLTLISMTSFHLSSRNCIFSIIYLPPAVIQLCFVVKTTGQDLKFLRRYKIMHVITLWRTGRKEILIQLVADVLIPLRWAFRVFSVPIHVSEDADNISIPAIIIMAERAVDVTIEKPKMTIQGYIFDNIVADKDDRKTFVFFFGIPYAKPPTEKSERYTAPKPFEYDPHGPLFKAYKGLKVCPQMSSFGDIITMKSDKKDDPLDCLYLNVYLPQRPREIKEPLAVMVYFHGGGFYQGSGNYPERTPEFMMLCDVVVVTVNYRLGPFGFLNLQVEECPGNAGLKDQVMALKWVRDNISCFGGDPNNVTIWGESAGGSCVNFHLISPLSKGLFKKAIIQSGGIYCPWGYTGDQSKLKQKYEDYDYHRICRGERKLIMVVDYLKEADYADILDWNNEMNKKISVESNIDIYVGPSIETVSSEDAFLPRGPKELIENAEPVEILAGITAQEGYITYELQKPIYRNPFSWILNDDRFREFLKAHLNWEEELIQEHFHEIRQKYFNEQELEFVRERRRSEGGEQEDEPDENIETTEEHNVREGLAKLCTDLWFYRFYDNIKLGDGSKPARTYIYKFDIVTHINPSHQFVKKLWAATHGDDIAYLLPHPRYRMDSVPYEDHVKTKIKTMCSLWSSFAKTSVPKSAFHDVKWEPHSEEEPRYLRIGEDLEMMQGKMNDDNHWTYLNELNLEDERRKSERNNSREQNTVASFPITLEALVDAVNRAKSVLSRPEAAHTSESSNPSPSCSGLKASTSKEGLPLSTLEVPSDERLKRHSPSRSPTCGSKTSKDESAEAKKGRKFEEDE